MHEFRHQKQTPNSLSFLSNMMLLVPVTRAGIYPRSLAWTEPSCRVLRVACAIQVIDEPWFDTHKVVVFSLRVPSDLSSQLQVRMPLSFANVAAGSA